jgi:dihydropteroate synthase
VVRDAVFDWGARTYVMAILNITTDSFSGDGLAGDLAAALRAGEAACTAGADILDVGGESTRPGADPVEVKVEIARVIPVVAGLRARLDVPISIDTSKSAVARAALDAGADIVNDVWGLRRDPLMAPLVADRRAPVVIMHNRRGGVRHTVSARVGPHYAGVEYADVVADVCRELGDAVEEGLTAGVAPERIIVDPGIGFAKTPEQNMAVLNGVNRVAELGYPVLVGPSRKSFIGRALDLPADERFEGTAAAVAVAIARGADVVRVHDVARMVRVVRMADAIVRDTARAVAGGSGP